jgi:hypothetical protein
MRALILGALLALAACPSQPVSLAGKAAGASQADSQKKIPLAGTATAAGSSKGR